MGHGVKQRDLIRMTDDEVEAFLQGRHTMALCSINHDSTIHAVAMWYGFLEGAVESGERAARRLLRRIAA